MWNSSEDGSSSSSFRGGNDSSDDSSDDGSDDSSDDSSDDGSDDDYQVGAKKKNKRKGVVVERVDNETDSSDDSDDDDNHCDGRFVAKAKKMRKVVEGADNEAATATTASLPPEPDEPLEFVADIRKKVAKRFVKKRKNINYDIEQNVREIRALLKINAEIFCRVIDSTVDCSSGQIVKLERYGFDVVKVRQRGLSTEFASALSALPSDLASVLVAQYQAAPFNKFIDYDAFFKSALMLHDNILEPFLATLKTRVECIHVILGEMESWLLESQRKIEFIESTFGVKLETPTAAHVNYKEETSACNCPSGTHAYSLACLSCLCNFSTHQYISRNCTAFICKKIVPKIHILKTCKETGKFEKTFQIATENDQTKLKKFLEYMDS